MGALSVLICICVCLCFEYSQSTTNVLNEDRMLLLLAAPRKSDSYYEKKFTQYTEFYVDFAKHIMNRDNVVVVVDQETYPYYKNKLPADILLIDRIEDPWIRDQGPVIPSVGFQFKLVAGLPSWDARYIQNIFNKFADKYGIKRTHTTIKNDGGNVVDNNLDKIIVSDQILQDNWYTKSEMKQELLYRIRGLKEVAIIPRDEPKLGHSDGQVMWVNKNTLFTNAYEGDFDDFSLQKFNNELKSSFPKTTIKRLAYKPEDKSTPDGFSSACGVYVNSVVTNKYIYVPKYGPRFKDEEAFKQIQDSVSGEKTVVQVDSKTVCELGGSLRCLSLQLQGKNAENIIKAARQQTKP